MTKTLISLIIVAALVACGSKASPAPHDHDHDAAGSGSAVVDTTPKEPEKPAEPTKTEPPKPDPKAELLAAETGAWDKAKPVFTKYCATCHTKDGKKAAKKKLDHFTMDTYPPGGHHTATIGFTIRDVLGISGKKPTMPSDKPGSVKGDELATIKAWTDAWEAAEKAGAHAAAGGHEDHHH